MIKSELVARLTARYPHLYHRDVERIVTTVLDEISKALALGHRVELRGFGAFSVKCRPARSGGRRPAPRRLTLPAPAGYSGRMTVHPKICGIPSVEAADAAARAGADYA